ncbi:MAG: NAD(P)/FAD-dependent oxidoreductase [Myxococcota bacterium]
MTRSHHEVIIVGAGHNGLVCAAYLARAGLDVLVLERRSIIGGCAVTEPLAEGFRAPTLAHAVGLLDASLIEELGLTERGLTMLVPDPAMAVMFGPHDGLVHWGDLSRTFAGAPWATAHDQDEYQRLLDWIDRGASVVRRSFLCPPPTPAWWHNELAAAGLAYEDVFTRSITAVLDRFHCDERLKTHLAALGGNMSAAGPDTPGTAFNLFRLCAAEVNNLPGAWGFVRGGTGALSEALARAATEAGATLRTDAPVSAIRTTAGRATGVTLRNGEMLSSDLVVSTADPWSTLLDLVPPADLPPQLRDRLQTTRPRGASMKILLALRGAPHLPLAGQDAPPAFVLIAPSIDYIRRAWQDAQRQEPSEAPLLECALPSVVDPTLAPEGQHVMSIHVQWTPHTLASDTWSTRAETYADHVLAYLDRYMPGLSDQVLARRVLTPPQIAATFGSTGGQCEHGDMILGPRLASLTEHANGPYGSPIEGLYLGGAGTHPGGTISGAPGHNAAAQILGSPRSASD